MKPASILVVEDERVVARDIQSRLTYLGYPVSSVAYTGEDALKKMEDFRPDIVLMDIMLTGSGLNGIETAARIRERFNIPVIYVTAYSDEDTLQKAKSTRPAGYLLKPFEDRELSTTIELAVYTNAMDQKLKESERWLATVLNSVGDGVIATDVKGGIRFMNPLAERLTGWKKEDAIDKELTEVFKAVDQDGESAVKKPISDGPSTGNIRQATLTSFDGVERAIDGTVKTIKDQKGHTLGIVIAFRDISERRGLEEQLRRSQKLEAVGQLAGGVAHDFNNLLGVIRSRCDVLLTQLSSEDSRRVGVEVIGKAVENAAALTRQLMAVSCRQLLRPKVMDINAVIDGMAEMLKCLLGERIEITCMMGSNVGRILMDPLQVEQIVLNLVVNSRDAMPNGGKLTIETANMDLDDGYTQRHLDVKKGHYVMLAVSDTGCGMDEATQARLFEPFFTTKEGKGSGLGLSIVYGIVKQGGGNIWVYSEKDRGTTFKIYLPRVGEVVETVSDKLYDEPLYGTETILLVEDNKMVREVTRDVLEIHGFTVIEASNPKEAILCCQNQHKLHLVLTDVVMPHLSGFDLAERLLAIKPKLKLLYMSGYPDGAMSNHGLLNKNTPFIQKPFASQALIRKLRDVLDAR